MVENLIAPGNQMVFSRRTFQVKRARSCRTCGNHGDIHFEGDLSGTFRLDSDFRVYVHDVGEIGPIKGVRFGSPVEFGDLRHEIPDEWTSLFFGTRPLSYLLQFHSDGTADVVSEKFVCRVDPIEFMEGREIHCVFPIVSLEAEFYLRQGKWDQMIL